MLGFYIEFLLKIYSPTYLSAQVNIIGIICELDTFFPSPSARYSH